MYREKVVCQCLLYWLAGPGGEDLEGGYYDAGDNLKVDTDTLCVMR